MNSIELFAGIGGISLAAGMGGIAMKSLLEVGYLKPGMVIVATNGVEAEIEKIGKIGFDEGHMVHFKGREDEPVMWDWDRLDPRVMVKSIPEEEAQ